ncbi:hypothetical protein RRF57_007518 [Xylaria bambusicola]|uniref:DUF1907 domain-containing protein n=1 Tax=Xylaria bambusicola TaxID=326684 RepID=A0AAN7V0Q7_9PEZI
MDAQKYLLSPPGLDELAEKLKVPLASNYEVSTISVVQCPDLREAPFYLATEGLSGDEKVADVGGRQNLFPRPRFNTTWSLTEIASAMEMSQEKGSLIGAGAGPFHVVGQNCELAPNLKWESQFVNIDNQTRLVKIADGTVTVEKSSSAGCALMVNLFGSLGESGTVLKITARKRIGDGKSFTECIRSALSAAYGDSNIISLGGAFVVKSGKARYHIMPDFPKEEDLPFEDYEKLDNWLTYHDFDGPIVCLSVLHSADPDGKLDLRMEHTHAFSPVTGRNTGGHYHYDIEDSDEDVEYEGYFNTAKVLYRIENPTAA